MPADILVVDDDPTNLHMLATRLRRRGYDVRPAGSAAEAEALMGEQLPDVLLLDVVMPEVSGLEFLRRLREAAATRTLPIILVTGRDRSDDVVEGLALGASDYVTKPVDFEVLLARLNTHMRLHRIVRRMKTQQDVLERLVAIDALTGVYNRRGLMEALASEHKQHAAAGSRFAIMMIDLDHFKAVNDQHGHAAGDDVLAGFARVATEALRASDILGRYGGEEFCALLTEVEHPGAELAAERLVQGTAKAPMATRSGDVSVTVSVGVAVADGESPPPVETLIERADKALYRAKRSGRDRWCMWSAELDG